MNHVEQQRFEDHHARLQRALRLQGKAKKTRQAYERAHRRAVEIIGRPADTFTAEDLKQYFDQLLTTHSWSTIRLDRCGLQFLFKHVLDKQWVWIEIVKPPKDKRLPDVLSKPELVKVLGHVRKHAYRVFLFTVYSMGLRLGEGLNLAVGDIDADRNQVHLRRAKGAKDRYVRLPFCTLKLLREFWTTHRHPHWLFPSLSAPHTATAPMDRGGIQVAMKDAVGKAQIKKRITIHTLRHSYATHLIEAGVNLRVVQDALGHANPKTTAGYLHLTEVIEQDTQYIVDNMAADLFKAVFPCN